MRIGIAVTLLVSIVALFVVWNLPIVMHFYDLAFPKPGLYEPILLVPFDFWSATSSLVSPLDCRWGRRIYEVSISVPARPPDSRAGGVPVWPDLGGEFLLTISRDGKTVLRQKFTGRARLVHQVFESGEPREIYSLSEFSLLRCDGSIVRIDVVKPAIMSSSLRGSARLIVRVSPEI